MRILIWGKTYPELSRAHKETVCTGGCTEDGKPIRLYPVPLRYLPDHAKYRLYDWVELPVSRSSSDSRPESYKVTGELAVVGHVETDPGWVNRRRILFTDKSWHYECLNDLKQREVRDKSSIGLIKVEKVNRVWVKQRTEGDHQAHQEKLSEIQSQIDMFESQNKDLEFLPFRIHVEWICAGDNCLGHTAGILDWGLCELGRKKGHEAAKAKMVELSDTRKYDLRFFVGNFKAHPKNFGVLGIWYPKKEDSIASERQSSLF